MQRNSTVYSEKLQEVGEHAAAASKTPETPVPHYPLAFYESLMRHDWHGKVRHRIRQRGWGWH